MGIERPSGPYSLEMTAGAAWPAADEDSFARRAEELDNTLAALTGAREDWEQHRHRLFGGEGVWSGDAATAAMGEIDSRTKAMHTLQEQLRIASTQATSAATAITEAKNQIAANVSMAQTIIAQLESLDTDDDVTGLVQQVVLKTYAANTEVITSAAARLTGPATVNPDSFGKGMKAFGNRGLKEDKPTPGSPQRPGEPTDPTNAQVGDERFGYWEDVPMPHKPWIGGSPPPLARESRDFPKDMLRSHTAGPTEWFVPNKSWAFDNEAPYTQLQEQYMVRIRGTEATPYSRVIDSGGVPTQQRWVQYNYEVRHNRQVVLGGDVRAKGVDGDIAGLGPFPWIAENWTPKSVSEIAQLSAANPGVQFNIPDGCGGQFAYKGGVPTSGWSAKPSEPPIMTRPR